MLHPEDLLSSVGRFCSVEGDTIATIDFRRVSEQFDVAFDLTLNDGRSLSVTRKIVRLFGILSRYPRWKRCTFCTDYSAELADISFGGVHVTTRTQSGEGLVRRALKDGTLKTNLTGEEFLRLSSRVDETMTLKKKKTNRQLIIHRRREGKPVPDYE